MSGPHYKPPKLMKPPAPLIFITAQGSEISRLLWREWLRAGTLPFKALHNGWDGDPVANLDAWMGSTVRASGFEPFVTIDHDVNPGEVIEERVQEEWTITRVDP